MRLQVDTIVQALGVASALAIATSAPYQAIADSTSVSEEQCSALPFYDIRYTSAGQPALDTSQETPSSAAREARSRAEQKLGDNVDGLRVLVHELFHTPHFVFASRGFLTEKSERSPAAVVKKFIADYQALFEIDTAELDRAAVTRNFRTVHNGVTHLTYQQQIRGIDVLGCVVQANVTGAGELINVESEMLPRPEGDFAVVKPRVADADAVRLASAYCGVEVSALPVADDGQAASIAFGRARLWSNIPGLRPWEPAESRPTYFPLSRTDIRSAWMVTVPVAEPGHTYDCVVDAVTGALLRRVDRVVLDSTQPVTMRVYTRESPSPMMPGLSAVGSTQPPVVPRELVVKQPADMIPWSPNGWISDGDTQTLGNNADAHLDRDRNNQPDLPRPDGGATRVFDFPIDLTLDPGAFRSATVTQAFFIANDFHDRMVALGFDEAAGNYQTTNFSGLGVGGDPIQIDVDDGVGLNQAFFEGSHGDGSTGRVTLTLFSGPAPRRDSALDAHVVYHELTHSMSYRLVNGLSTQQAGGMGEGWSDFVSLCITTRDGMDPNAVYPHGGYITYHYLQPTFDNNYYFGIRRFPYCTNMQVNPETYHKVAQANFPADVPRNPVIGNSIGEVHQTGEVWCEALWEARAALCRRYGFAANQIMLQLVVDGMKLCPSEPTLVDARWALLQADQVDFAGAHSDWLWWAFAKRGLGLSSSSSGTSVASAHEAFDVPNGVSFLYPEGVPTQVGSDSPTTFPVDISSWTLSVDTASPRLHYSINGGPFQIATLAGPTGTAFVATIPPVGPAGNVDFYFTTDTSTGSCANPALAPSVHYSANASRCPADLDNGNGAGSTDGAVTIDDLLYFLAQFEAGGAGADLDDGSAAGHPDGAVTIDDLLFFLEHFEAGC